jgi:hypothetical protein
LTWRLYGRLPPNRFSPPGLTAGEAFAAMDHVLDQARTGPPYLQRPEVAQIVVDSIHYCEQEMYDLHAYVVMANHVHLLINPRIEVSRLTQSLKRYTARSANRFLGLAGPFWQDESYDRLSAINPNLNESGIISSGTQ